MTNATYHGLLEDLETLHSCSVSLTTVVLSLQVDQVTVTVIYRVLTNAEKVEQITPVIRFEHWLSVCQMI